MPRTAMITTVALGATLLLGLSGCDAGLVGLHSATAATGPQTASSGAPRSTDSAPGGQGAEVSPAAPGVSGPVDTMAGAPAVSTSSSPSASSIPSAARAAPTGTTPIAGADFTRSGGNVLTTVNVRLRFDVLSLTRQGQLLQLLSRITNEQVPRTDSHGSLVDQTWRVAGLSDINRTDMKVDGFDAFNAVSLTDGVNKKRYLVAADSSGRCVCSTGLLEEPVDAGQAVVFSATFQAPPLSTTSLQVDVPGIGSFADVPIS